MNDTTNTNEETVSAAEFYDQIYSGFTNLSADDLEDFYQSNQLLEQERE